MSQKNLEQHPLFQSIKNAAAGSRIIWLGRPEFMNGSDKILISLLGMLAIVCLAVSALGYISSTGVEFMMAFLLGFILFFTLASAYSYLALFVRKNTLYALTEKEAFIVSKGMLRHESIKRFSSSYIANRSLEKAGKGRGSFIFEGSNRWPPQGFLYINKIDEVEELFRRHFS